MAGLPLPAFFRTASPFILQADGSVFVFSVDSVAASFQVHSTPLQKCQSAMDPAGYWEDGLDGLRRWVKRQTSTGNKEVGV
jgi:hypothetical protein